MERLAVGSAVIGRKSSNAAGQADGSSWDHRNCWTRPLAIALPPNLAAK